MAWASNIRQHESNAPKPSNAMLMNEMINQDITHRNIDTNTPDTASDSCYRQTSKIKRTNPKTYMILVPSCSCFCPIHWKPGIKSRMKI